MILFYLSQCVDCAKEENIFYKKDNMKQIYVFFRLEGQG